MRRILIGVVAMLATATGSASFPAEAAGTNAPVVFAEISDGAGIVVTGSDAPEGSPLHINVVVTGGQAAPTGIARVRTYAGTACAGAASGEQAIALAADTTPIAHSTEISNLGGWDSATIWSSQSGNGFGTDWFGSVFMGTDPPFFSHSGAAWRFADVPLSPDDSIESAHLLLRIKRSRPNLASDSFGTWTTAIRVDPASGTAFSGLNHDSFLARFAGSSVPWQMAFTYAERDPFATQQATSHASSPDISSLIAPRIASASWGESDDDLVIGILDNASPAIAEAQVIDVADNVRLHIDWTSPQPAGLAASAPATESPGPHSYRVHYDGDGVYAATDSDCLAIEFTPTDSDGDGYGDLIENQLGKDPGAYCAVMRADIDGSGSVSILDLSRGAQRFGESAPPAPRRLLQDSRTQISILDLSLMASQFTRSIATCP